MTVFASFWYGAGLSPYEVLAIRSFLDHGHSFRLYSYQSVDVPKGCVLFDASKILPADNVFFYVGGKEKKVSAFSNMFRYSLLAQEDIVWTDTDVVCLKDSGFDREFVFAMQDEEYYNGAVLKFPPGHNAMKLASQYCWERRDKAMWGDLGPRLLTKIIDEYDLHLAALPTKELYPVHWRDMAKLFDPALGESIIESMRNSLTLHLWNDMFSRVSISKTDRPRSGSAVARFLDMHKVEWFDPTGKSC